MYTLNLSQCYYYYIIINMQEAWSLSLWNYQSSLEGITPRKSLRDKDVTPF